MPKDSGLKEFRENIAQMLCSYYNATQGLKKGVGVSPIDCGVEGGRGFKARYMLPGRGKRGGLRLGVLALCSRRVVTIAFAEERKEDPSDSEMRAAFVSARRP
jgi:hypothetical protein